MNFLAFNVLFSGHGFGINTNVLETNIINLAVVIAVVVSFVGDAIRELLKNRKDLILNNLREADQRALLAQENLNQAKSQLAVAQKKAAEIISMGNDAAEQERALMKKQGSESATQLKTVQENTLRFMQQKAVQQISQQIVSRTIQQVREKFKKASTSAFQLEVNVLTAKLFKRSPLASTNS